MIRANPIDVVPLTAAEADDREVVYIELENIFLYIHLYICMCMYRSHYYEVTLVNHRFVGMHSARPLVIGA